MWEYHGSKIAVAKFATDKDKHDGENNNKQYTRECSGYNFP